MEIITKVFNDKNIYFNIKSENNKLYLNATKTAKQFNKRLDNWKNSKEVIEYMEIISRSLNLRERDLMIVIQGGNDKNAQGTWLHKKLVVLFARWLSPEFAVWCDTQIKEILKTGSYKIQPKDDISELENSLKVTKIASQFLDIFHRKNKLQLLYLDNFVKSETGSSIIEKFGIDLKNQFFLPTELGNFIGKSGVEINQIFANFGFQEKTNGVWKLLERGQEFGSVFHNGSNLQIKWKLSVLEKI